MSRRLFVFAAVVFGVVAADPTGFDVLGDIYTDCLRHFSFGCVKPKALGWLARVGGKPVIKITEDLAIVKKSGEEVGRTGENDIFEKFEDFLASHELVAKVPQPLRPGGSLGNLLPRSMQPEDLRVPLAATGRSKIVKKVIVPFLLGLKFKTAVLVPLALALIALKTWKALTLGLLSLVLTGALIIFKFSKPKVAYEVIHYPHPVEHHVEPPSSGWSNPGYGRELSGNEMAYNAYLKA